MSRLRTLAILIFSASFLLAPGAFAADSASAETYVKERHGELIQLLKKPKSKAVDAKISKAFDDMLDYDTLAKRSLRRYWDDRTDEEKKEFTSVLKRLVQRAHQRSLRKTLDFSVDYKGAESQDKVWVVKTVAKSKTDKREQPVTIEYVLEKRGKSFKCVDIRIEGSSLVANYRSQFRRIIRKHGFKDLMRRMNEKLDEDE